MDAALRGVPPPPPQQAQQPAVDVHTAAGLPQAAAADAAMEALLAVRV